MTDNRTETHNFLCLRVQVHKRKQPHLQIVRETTSCSPMPQKHASSPNSKLHPPP